MARSIWNGVISFGLVSIPVGLHTATQERDLRFNQLHKPCGSRIKQQRFCPTCERTVEQEEVDRGFELSKGSYAVVSDEDFEALPVPSKHAIEVTSFVKADEIDSIFFDQSYYLEPGETARKPFALLLRALKEKGVLAVGKIAIRNKEALCVLRPSRGTLVLETLFYEDEIRKPEAEGIDGVEVDERELGMAKSLVELLEKAFDPGEYKDAYRSALLERIEAKQHGGQITTAPEPKEARVVNLMDALRASLEEAQQKKKSG
ncbi:MAG: Ku protein [Fimbriimonas ginsengisoli]|uniref:Non-homologous end joining protein Ku n=1 Tax=Fimbriimonas ginsengisoli TaxID=1005039 RepID=A0A931LT27_FIMGI|nr:Ku protein [Fimbriimonas ginsengisoli]